MKPIFRKSLYALAVVSVLNLSLMHNASAHCDGMDGPVIADAQRALARGDVTPLLRWVPAADEGQIKAVFDKAARVRKLGREAQELADRQFFATLVEVHRASEGAPFAGIKAAGGFDPAESAADAALVNGNIDSLVVKITKEVEQGIRQRFAAAMEAKTRAERSVPQGREYVGRYVQYLHYVEGVRNAISATGDHAEGEAPAGGQGACPLKAWTKRAACRWR